MKKIDMREYEDLNNLYVHDLFNNLKAYEFEIETRSGEQSIFNNQTKALTVTFAKLIQEKAAKQLSND